VDLLGANESVLPQMRPRRPLLGFFFSFTNLTYDKCVCVSLIFLDFQIFNLHKYFSNYTIWNDYTFR
jgi:hypothetical protein